MSTPTEYNKVSKERDEAKKLAEKYRQCLEQASEPYDRYIKGKIGARAALEQIDSIIWNELRR